MLFWRLKLTAQVRVSHAFIVSLSICGLLGTLLLLQFLPTAPIAQTLRDFDVFWLTGYLVHQGEVTSIYSSERMGLQIASFFGTAGGAFGLLYPPPTILFFLSLPLLPLTGSFLIFLIGSFLLVLVLAYKAAGLPGLLLAIGFSGLHSALDYGQLTPLVMSLLGLSLLQLARKPSYSGFLLSLGSLKPHLVGLYVIGLAAAKYWRSLQAAAFFLAILLLLSSLVLPGAWSAFGAEFFANLKTPMTNSHWFTLMASPYATLRAWSVPVLPAVAMQLVLSFGAVFLIVRLFRQTAELADPRPERLVALGLLTTLATPFAYDYDNCLHLLACLGWARRAQTDTLTRAEIFAFIALYLIPILSLGRGADFDTTLLQFIAVGLGLYGLYVRCRTMAQSHPKVP